ncbi:MAG: poly(R)-hydroxyalkanoic acid synthase subunit PhaE [Caldilineaceae bacterium]
MNYWYDLQRDLMKNWFNMGQSAQPMNPFWSGVYTNGGGQNPWTNAAASTAAGAALWGPWGEMFAQQAKQMQDFWSGNGQNGFNWFDGAMAESARRTADKMVESQMFVLKMFESMAQSWLSAVQTDDVAKWQTDLAQQMQAQFAQMQAQWDAAANQWGEMAESSSQLWQTYIEQLQQMGLPWLNAGMASAEQAAAWGRNLSIGQVNPTNLMGHFWQAYEDTLGKMVSSPPLGLTRELNLALTKGFETWLAYRRADAEYQRVVSSGWLQFLDAFGKRLTQMTQEGKLIESPRQFIDLWVEVGDDEFTKLFQGDAYAEAQGNLVNSSMAFKRQQRTLLEIWLRTNDMPTRSDLDEAHRTIYELRKDLKALKKEVRTLQQQWADAATASPVQNDADTRPQKLADAPPSSPQKPAAKAKTTTRARTARKSSARATTSAGR